MVEKIKLDSKTEETKSIVVNITFFPSTFYFKLYDEKTLQLVFESKIYEIDDNFIDYVVKRVRDSAVKLVVYRGITSDEDLRLEIVRTICVHYHVHSFSTQIMHSLITDSNYFPHEYSDDIYTECMSALRSDDPAYSYIRPYMCELTSKVIDLFNISNPLRIMYRYKDICEKRTIYRDNRFVITNSSSITEIDIPIDLINELVSDGNTEIWRAHRLCNSTIDEAFKVRSVDGYVELLNVQKEAIDHNLPIGNYLGTFIDSITDEELRQSICCSSDSDLDRLWDFDGAWFISWRIFLRCLDIRNGATKIENGIVHFSYESNFLELNIDSKKVNSLFDEFSVKTIGNVPYNGEYRDFVFRRALYDDGWTHFKEK